MTEGRSKLPHRGPAFGRAPRAPKLADVYLPKHFAARDRAAVEAFVDAVGAADLVTFDGAKPVASLIPVIWERPADGLGGAVESGSALGGAVGSGSALGGAVGSGS